MRIWAIPLILALAATALGDPGDVFVDNESGLESSNGTAPSLGSNRNGPVRTISQAYKRVVPGGRIILLPTGTPYHESAVLWGGRVHGYSHAPIILEGNGQVLTGVTPIDPYRWEREPGGYVRLLGPVISRAVLFDGIRPLSKTPAALWGARPTLQPGQYAVWDGTILFRVAPADVYKPLTLGESRLESGLLIKRASNLIIRDLTIRGFAIDGVQVWGPVKGVLFENCRFEYNARSGAFVSTNSSVEFVQCTWEGNLEAGLIADNFASVRLLDSAVQASPQPIRKDDTSKVEQTGSLPKQQKPKPTMNPPGYRGGPKPPAVPDPINSTPVPIPTKKPAESEDDPSDR